MATSTEKKAAAGIAAAAAAAGAAAAGYYFYASRDAKKHRRLAANWAQDLKREVVKQGKKVQKMDRSQFLRIVDNAAATYETVRAINKKDLQKAAQELKNNWQLVAQEASGALKSTKRTAKKTASKTRATVKKTARTSKKRR